MRSINIEYVKGIDHLRCFSALIILIYHSFQLIYIFLKENRPFNFGDWIKLSNPLYSIIIEGHVAVALFMVMSGFILTYGALDKPINYKNFIINRILRIYPLFIAFIFLGISVYPQSFTFSALIQSLVCFSNAQGALNFGPITGIFWTLSVEFLFYLIFPFVVTILGKKQGYKTIMHMIVAMLSLRCIGCLLGGKPVDLSYWSIMGRLDQFLIGMLAAYLYKRNVIENGLYKRLLLPSLLALTLGLFFYNKIGSLPANHYFEVLWITIEGLMCGALILCYISYAQLIPNILSKAFCYIGSISYSIYLVHFIIIDILIKYNILLKLNIGLYQLTIINTVILTVPITLLLASITYRGIEKPFMQLRKRYYNDPHISAL